LWDKFKFAVGRLPRIIEMDRVRYKKIVKSSVFANLKDLRNIPGRSEMGETFAVWRNCFGGYRNDAPIDCDQSHEAIESPGRAG